MIPAEVGIACTMHQSHQLMLLLSDCVLMCKPSEAVRRIATQQWRCIEWHAASQGSSRVTWGYAARAVSARRGTMMYLPCCQSGT